jgi:hypothetical protein
MLADGYARAGMPDQALHWLTVAVDRDFINYPILAVYDPLPASLRNLPLFQHLMARVRDDGRVSALTSKGLPRLPRRLCPQDSPSRRTNRSKSVVKSLGVIGRREENTTTVPCPSSDAPTLGVHHSCPSPLTRVNRCVSRSRT